jgi:hypothetical protein
MSASLIAIELYYCIKQSIYEIVPLTLEVVQRQFLKRIDGNKRFYQSRIPQTEYS